MTETVLSLYRGEIIKPASVTMRAIAELVAERYGLTLDDLKGQRRSRRIAHPRQEAMWLMRQVRFSDGRQRYSFPMIGDFLGGRDHTTIQHGCRAYAARLAALKAAA